MKIRIINAYGPQEDETQLKRLTYWQSLEQEISSGENENCMILLQMDANAKLGNNIINQDPNEMSDNGRLLQELIERENLALLKLLVSVYRGNYSSQGDKG